MAYSEDITNEEVALFASVAGLLGEGYTARRNTEWRHLLMIANAVTGAELSVHHEGTRYEIWARTPGDHYFTTEQRAEGLKPNHQITVSDKKSAGQIAADITRRLLPDYLRSLAVVREAADAQAKRQAARENELARLRAVGGGIARIGTDRGGNEESVSIPYDASRPYGGFKATQWDHGTKYTVELHNVSPELAGRIMTLLAGARQAD